MAEMLIDGAKLDACLDAEADAIRAKTGGSTDIPFDYANNKGFADAIAAIPSGATITDGIVFTAFDANGNPTAADIYGNLPLFAFGYYGNQYGYGRYIANIAFKGGTEVIKSGAFQTTAITNIIIPDSVNVIGTECFRSSSLGSYIHENPRGLYAYGGNCVRALQNCPSDIETIQLGSIGKPLTSLNYQFMTSRAYSALTLTIYCIGANVDGFLTSARRAITGGKIVFKASEATTYNGTSYAAGDTILTSEVT